MIRVWVGVAWVINSECPDNSNSTSSSRSWWSAIRGWASQTFSRDSSTTSSIWTPSPPSESSSPPRPPTSTASASRTRSGTPPARRDLEPSPTHTTAGPLGPSSLSTSPRPKLSRTCRSGWDSLRKTQSPGSPSCLSATSQTSLSRERSALKSSRTMPIKIAFFTCRPRRQLAATSVRPSRSSSEVLLSEFRDIFERKSDSSTRRPQGSAGASK